MDKRVVLYLFFVIVATVLWFLIALSKNYYSEIRYPINYTRYTGQKILINQDKLPPNLSLQVNAQGFSILSYKLGRPKPIVININKLKLIPAYGGDTSNYFIFTTELKRQIESDLSKDVLIENITPDSIHFQFAHLISKRVAVRPDTKITYGRQYFPTDSLEVVPDSITIRGPDIIVDTCNYIYTKHINIELLTDSISRNVQLMLPNDVKSNHDKVLVTQHVEKFTEGTFRVPIQVVNVPDSVNIKLFPSHCRLSFLAALSQFESVRATQFTVEFDYTKINFNSEKIQLELKKSPKGLKNVRFYPNLVEYIIEK